MITVLNPLFDTEFLDKLSLSKSKEVFARIIALTHQERPVEQIEGRVTGGNINVDGKSVVRRTCTLNMVATDVKINDYYWGVKNKFTLEIGLKNEIDPKYPDIIWFKQGMFVIHSFKTTEKANAFTINISGKDKMCLLNGDLGGAFMHHTIDFGVEEYYDKETDTVTYTDIPVKTIIREMMQNFGNELAQNIIINDIEDAGLELLEYRGDVPMYLFKTTDAETFINMTFDGTQPCYYKDGDNWISTTISDDKNIQYDSLNKVDGTIPGTIIKFNIDSKQEYTIAKIEYGDTPGYRLTDLVYAGELVAKVGENVTSVLDKLKKMLGDFEYFYNIDGQFVFQRRQNRIVYPWNNPLKDEEKFTTATIDQSAYMANLINSFLVTSIQNNPNIANLRNDFAVWGSRKTKEGAEIPIHMRYAVDFKPKYYKNYAGEIFISEEYEEEIDGAQVVDWREVIYQMALDYFKHYHDDDFLYTVGQNNLDFYPTGRTGYEQYYTDLQGFWRTLYNPEPELKLDPIPYDEVKEEDFIVIKNGYRLATEEEREKLPLNQMYVFDTHNGDTSIYPYLTSKYFHLIYDDRYFFLTDGTKMDYSFDSEVLNKISIDKLYDKYTKPFLTQENFKGVIGERPTQAEIDGVDQIQVPEDIYDIPELDPFKVLLEYEENPPDGAPREEFHVYKYELGTDYSGFDYYKLVDRPDYRKLPDVPVYVKEKVMKFSDMPEEIKNLYAPKNKDGVRKFQQYLNRWGVDNYNETLENRIGDFIQYGLGYYDFWTEEDEPRWWTKLISTNPEGLLFWFDFIGSETSDSASYAVPIIGMRAKAVNDTKIKSIFYKEVPMTIFRTPREIEENKFEKQTGYTYVQLQSTLENLFAISSKGQSLQNKMDELLYQHLHCAEKVNLQLVPIYYLEPNHHILIRNEDTTVDGEYLVEKIAIQLKHDGMMTVNTTKVVESIT